MEVKLVTVSYLNGEHEAILEEPEGDHVVVPRGYYEELCKKAGEEVDYGGILDLLDY